jgi:hypothetical protein
MTRDERAAELVRMLLERAHAREPMAAMLRVAEPREVQVAAELLALAMAALVDRRVERSLDLEDELAGECGAMAARVCELEDEVARLRRPWWLRWWWR